MATVSGTSLKRTDLYDSSRYRSTVAISITLLVVSAVLVLAFYRGSAPSIEGQPSYLFSMPSTTDRSEPRAALNGPLAVAAYGDRIAVADSGAGKIKTYGWAGKYVAEVDLARTKGGPGRKAYPTGLAYDDEGRLFVADVMSDRIYVFDAGLELLYSFPEKRASLRLVQPVALCIRGDELYVTDVGDSSVKVFSLDGTLGRELVSQENRRVALAFPNGVGVNSEGTVYVADSNNRKVIALDQGGKQLFVFRHAFGLPRGIFIDELDRVHVVDTFGHKVAVFAANGKPLFSYGTPEDPTKEQLGFANGIWVDSRTARVYVADRGANKVQVWGWE